MNGDKGTDGMRPGWISKHITTGQPQNQDSSMLKKHNELALIHLSLLVVVKKVHASF